MENYILLAVFIMCLCGVFAIADLCVNLIANRRRTKANKFFDYKL
jgi:hypothetical protein